MRQLAHGVSRNEVSGGFKVRKWQFAAPRRQCVQILKRSAFVLMKDTYSNRRTTTLKCCEHMRNSALEKTYAVSRLAATCSSCPHRIWQSDYEQVGDHRVVILPKAERTTRRAEVVRNFVTEFGLSSAQLTKIETLKLPSGWEPYSVEALQAMLPHLEDGVRFGELVNGPDRETWRVETFPDREQPTGEVFDRLPSPADREERERIASLRNPPAARTRNELRKVVNNLIDLYGKPGRIHVEVARDVGNSKRQREEKASGIRRQELRRTAAREALQQNGIAEPSRTDIEK